MEGLVLSDLVRDLILNILNILILFFIVRSLAYKPVKKFLDARKARIEKEQADAKELQAQAERSMEEYHALMRESESRANEIIRVAEQKARENSEEITAEAKQQAETIKQKAREDAKKTQRRALVEMKDEVTDLAFQISEKILSREVNEEDNKRIAEEFLDHFVQEQDG